MRLIGTEPLDELLETMIWTARVKDAIPISALLIASSGAGKSKTLLRFHSPTIQRCDDITTSGLQELLSTDRDNKINHIVLPDFNVPLSHKGGVANLTVANMLTVMSDGTMEIRDGRRKMELVHKPVGFLTGCTRSMFLSQQKHWAKLGLLRRFYPVFYTYSPKTVMLAQRAITTDKVDLQMPDRKEIKLPDAVVKVFVPQGIGTEIEKMAGILGNQLGMRYVRSRDKEGVEKWRWLTSENETVLPMSPQLVLRAMARAHALKCKRRSVTGSDLEFLHHALAFADVSAPVKL
jgi:hypothetical protein